MKKKEAVIKRILDLPSLETYLDPNLNKIIILNAFEEFWGPVDVIDYLVRRLIDEPGNNDKMAFISCDRNLCPDLFGKHQFTSKPTYFLLHRGTVIDLVDGLDFPLLLQKLEKGLTLL